MDGPQVKTVSLDRFHTVIQKAHPNAKIETRDGTEYVVIPTYDATTDTEGEELLLLDRSEGYPPFKPGDVLSHTKTGALFDIVDPLKHLFKIRKGPKAD